MEVFWWWCTGVLGAQERRRDSFANRKEKKVLEEVALSGVD